MKVNWDNIFEIYKSLDTSHLFGLVALAVLAYSAFIIYLIISRKSK